MNNRIIITETVSACEEVHLLVVVAVGKSCLLLQFTDKRFQPVHDLTIGKRFDALCMHALNLYIVHF